MTGLPNSLPPTRQSKPNPSDADDYPAHPTPYLATRQLVPRPKQASRLLLSPRPSPADKSRRTAPLLRTSRLCPYQFVRLPIPGQAGPTQRPRLVVPRHASSVLVTRQPVPKRVLPYDIPRHILPVRTTTHASAFHSVAHDCSSRFVSNRLWPERLLFPPRIAPALTTHRSTPPRASPHDLPCRFLSCQS